MTTTFTRLSTYWNAEPNAPHPRVFVEGDTVILEFFANPFQYPAFADGQQLRLRFTRAQRYRLGATNDEGWYAGACRFSGAAPAWGEFYEVAGDLKLDLAGDWVVLPATTAATAAPAAATAAPAATAAAGRHFLFYLRDETFECTAGSWQLET